MSYYKAVFKFNRSIEEKSPEERVIQAKMSTDPLFADPPVPYADFLISINAQQLAVDNAQSGARDKIALMRTKEREVDNMVRKYRDYVTDIADGNTDIILSSGFKHTKPRASAGDMPKVKNVKNMRSEESGTLKLKWSRVENAAFYEVDVREVVSEQPMPPDPTPPIPPTDGSTVNGPEVAVVERPWKTVASRPANAVITGLTPLKYYEVRVRAKGTKGYGAYSDVVVMVVT
ncbi:MAG: hypothetical protein GC178_11550 [Flavobacteriales bacterium]|nr:hypothetical protein [Flavobacteriales bacterium]